MKSFVLRRITYLYGENFQVNHGDILIERGKIQGFYPAGKGPASKNEFQGDQYIALPGLINSHIHLLDGQAREKWLGHTIPQLFGPGGWKAEYLRSTPDEELIQGARQAWRELLRCGITRAVVFVEEGLRGLDILEKALPIQKIQRVLLGRPNKKKFTTKEIESLLERCHGLGLAGLSHYSDDQLRKFRSLCEKKGKLLATHIAEVGPSKNVKRAVEILGVDFLVHGNYLNSEEKSLIGARKIPLALSIRSGYTFGRQVPDLAELKRQDISFALATDNLMSNSPNLFREMEFVARHLHRHHRGSLPFGPEEILSAVTVEGAKLAGWKDCGVLREGASAHILLLKKEGHLEPFQGSSSLIFRAEPSDIEWIFLSTELWKRSEI